MLGKSPTEWRQRPGMTIAVDWIAKSQINHLTKYFTREY